MAALAFIPLANLWLLTKLSKTALSANRVPTTPLLTGGLGVLSGFAMLIAAVVLTTFIGREADRIGQTDLDLDSMVRSRGLEATLRLMAGASEAQLPISVDDVTKLTRIEADGTQLHRTYVVTLDMVTITDAFRAGITDTICAYEFFIPLLRAGATIREVYIRADGSPIGEVLVTRNKCGL